MPAPSSSHNPTNAKHPANGRHWIMAYDISNNSRRRRIARLLEGHAQRIQRSVFSTVCTQHEAVALLSQAQALLRGDDQLVAWPVVKHSALDKPWKQQQKRTALPAYWIV
jgi:CRISPR-associated endonuclease Cas2